MKFKVTEQAEQVKLQQAEFEQLDNDVLKTVFAGMTSDSEISPVEEWTEVGGYVRWGKG